VRVTVPSFAKINIGLRIGALRPDGFHELRTVYQTVALHDSIRVSVARGSGVEIRCGDPRVPTNSTNTCYKIAERVIDALKVRGRVVIEIEKHLPVQGGVGGASGNAVATMLALERALKKKLAPATRLEIAQEVGSDLPLFLIGGTVLGVGRGEEVYPLPEFPALTCAIALPEVAVSTPKAFADWDQLCGAGAPLTSSGQALAREDQGTSQQNLINATVGVGKGTAFSRADFAQKMTYGTTEGRTLPGELEQQQVPRLRRSSASERSSALGMTEFSSKERSAAGSKLTSPTQSDRMVEFSREISAWLSAVPEGQGSRRSGVSAKGGGRAENLLLDLVRTGIENDFERVVFPQYPELHELKRVLEQTGARYASLSGSGSALYGLFDSRTAAENAAKKLSRSGTRAIVTSTLTRRQYWKKLRAVSN
jgi:4-diphosphocytidyl-2-C-methyl-D-erythritol kinase